MKNIFEQFQFIPEMLNPLSRKVYECSMWSLTYFSAIWLVEIMTKFTVNIVGMSVLYSILLFFVMIADFITGIRASKKEWLKEHPGEKWESESKKGLRWVIKYFTYISGFFIINVISKDIASISIGSVAGINVDEVLTLTFKAIKIYFMLYILRWELKSIDENFKRLGYNLPVFGFFSNAVAALTSLIKSKTGISINDKTKDKDNG